jgi:hypothetical protein
VECRAERADDKNQEVRRRLPFFLVRIKKDSDPQAFLGQCIALRSIRPIVTPSNRHRQKMIFTFIFSLVFSIGASFFHLVAKK